VPDRPGNDTRLGRLTEAELADQPAAWSAAARSAAASSGALDVAGSRMAATGCGTSYYIGGAFAELRETAGSGETDAFIASRIPTGRTYDTVVALSRSGTTRDLVHAMRSIPPATRRIAITGTPRSPIAAAADDVVDLSFADDRSVVQTRFATTALAFLRAAAGDDLAPVIRQGHEALHDGLPEVGRYRHVVFLGSGWGSWLAAEAALKLREMAHVWCESYLDVEYEHGPVSVAGPGTLVWSLGPLSADVRACVEPTGAHIAESQRDPMAELVRVHRYGLALARSKDIDCDRPRYLRRSVA
jgi:fructoselysine-6-P-deglycase FrlB-like protein